MNGDDAAGVLVVRSLQVICEKRNDLLLVEGGIAPENFSGQLRRFKPDLVLMVDAADFGGEPGEVSWIEPGQIDGFSASTHSLPPSMLADFLVHEIGCEVCFLGIQAVSLEFGQPLSGAVRKACRQITSEVKKNLSKR